MSYIKRVQEQTPTRIWINNPTAGDLEKALDAGAINGTSNPAYPYKLILREPEYVLPIIDEVAREVEDDLEAADLVYQRVARRFMETFMPLYEQSGGTQGLVTMQDDPFRDEDPDEIIEASLRHAKVCDNYMAKIPVIESGMDAMAELIREGIPVCATECFSIAQTVAMCELYEQVSEECGRRPPFFITHITGIYDEELQSYVTRRGIEIEPEVLRQAGCIVARKEYHLIKERGYHTTILGGGARGPRHFTEFVGGDFHVTMNWSTIAELNEMDPPVASRIDHEPPAEVLEELRAKLPDFRRAYDDDGLTPPEFATFPPLVRFRNNFVEGCTTLKLEIAKSRLIQVREGGR